MLKHSKQIGHTTCGAVAYKILLSDTVELTEKEAKKECKTGKGGKRGTYSFDVLAALRARGIDAHSVELNVDFIEYSRWLDLNSMGRKLYLACHYVDKACGGKGGRNSERHHAVTVSNGMVYDPGENQPCPIGAYMDVFSKKLTIKTMILVDIQ